MASLTKSFLIRELRLRMGLKQHMLLDYTRGENIVSRIETGGQEPLFDTFSDLMQKLNAPVGAVFYPFLTNVTTDVYDVRDHILHCLDFAEEFPLYLEEAKILFDKIQTMGDFSNGINRQMVLSIQARMYELEGRDPGEIIAMSREGLMLTYPEYKLHQYNGELLLFEESTLMHCEAMALAKSNPAAAIALLQKITKGIERFPGDSKDKEKRLPPVLLDLSQLLIEIGDYRQALEICEIGFDTSLKRDKAKHVPDFIYNKALILTMQGQKEEAAKLLMPVYCGFIVMRQRKKAEKVLELAEKLSIKLETHGVENLPLDMPEVKFDHGKPIPAKSIGDLIYGLRNDAELKQKELCMGVCTHSTLGRIETGEIIQGNVYHLEVFMQRLGRDINKYFTTFLDRDEHEGKQLRDEVRSLTVNRRYEEAKVQLEKLKKHKHYKKGVNLQFIALQEATIHIGLVGYDTAHLEMLKEVWAMTKNDFETYDAHDIAKTRLSNYEIVILNQIAGNISTNGKGDEAVRIFESLVTNMEKFYVDESERIRLYMTVLYNYCNKLEMLGRHEETYDIAVKGEGLCLKHRQLKLMPGFYDNKACALDAFGEKEKSISYFVAACYVDSLLGYTAGEEAIKKHIKKRFNIDLD